MLIFEAQYMFDFWLLSSVQNVPRIILKKKFWKKIYGFCSKNEFLWKKGWNLVRLDAARCPKYIQIEAYTLAHWMIVFWSRANVGNKSYSRFSEVDFCWKFENYGFCLKFLFFLSKPLIFEYPPSLSGFKNILTF